MGVRPGQSLSWTHSAHSRSRDLSRGIRRPPGEAGIGSGLLWEQGHRQGGLRKIFLLPLFFFSLFHFVQFLVLLLLLFFIFYFYFF